MQLLQSNRGSQYTLLYPGKFLDFTTYAASKFCFIFTAKPTRRLTS